MTDFLEDQVSMFDADTSCGRTYAEPTAAIQAETSRRSSRKSSASRTRRPLLFHCLKAAGRNTDATIRSWETGASPIAPWTLNSLEPRRDGSELHSYVTSTDSPLRRYSLTLNCGEKPRQNNPTKLSEVMEEMVSEKYRLSEKACLGILKRAERRGKELPRELKETLQWQAGLSDCRNVYENRKLVTAVDCRNCTENSEINGTIQAKKEGTSLNLNYVVRVAGFSFGQSAKARSLGYEEELSPTIRGGEGGNQKPVVLVVKNEDENHEA